MTATVLTVMLGIAIGLAIAWAIHATGETPK